VTGLSAVALAHAPDIALGDVLGSGVFHLVVLSCAVRRLTPVPSSG